MRASLSDRVRAYLIDIIIMLVILGIINILYSPDITEIRGSMNEATLDYVSSFISFSEYTTLTSSLYKQMDISNILLNIINVIYMIVYFVIVPYFNKGKTVGMMISKIQIVAMSNQELGFKNLFLRSLIINGIFYLIIIIPSCFLVPDDIYFAFISCLGFIQIVLIVVSILMAFYRNDKRGIHDLFANTWIAKE